MDATTRGFLGLTVACAQCHDHKYDPIPTQDYYSLLGIFNNTKLARVPAGAGSRSGATRKQQKKIEKQEKAIKEFVKRRRTQLADILASQTARYLLAARGLEPARDLDRQTLDAAGSSTWTRWNANILFEGAGSTELAGCDASAADSRSCGGVPVAGARHQRREEAHRREEPDQAWARTPAGRDLSSASLVSLASATSTFCGGTSSRAAACFTTAQKEIGRYLHGRVEGLPGPHECRTGAR